MLYITIISLVVIFSIFKTKLILYVLPVFGFVSIATAKALSEVSTKSLKIYNRIILALIVIFLLGILSIRFLNLNIEFNTISAIVIIVLSVVITIIVFKKRFLVKYLKTAVLGFILGCIILVSGTQFLIQNENLLNCPKKAIHFIDNDLQGIDNILVFNYLLASTNFYSDKNIVTINNGHNTVQRETQFEKDANWKENLIDLKTESGKQKVKELIENNSALLMRKRDKFRDAVKFVELAYTHKKEFGKWVVYY